MIMIAHSANEDKPIYPAIAPAVQAMHSETATLQQMMHSVTVNGTAEGVFAGLPYAVAGKTGTAQNPQFDQEPHSWFIGFAPYSNSHVKRVLHKKVVKWATTEGKPDPGDDRVSK